MGIGIDVVGLPWWPRSIPRPRAPYRGAAGYQAEHGGSDYSFGGVPLAALAAAMDVPITRCLGW